MKIFAAALVLGIAVLTATPWGHAAESRAEWFRVNWEPRPTSVLPRIGGRIHNQSQYRVTNVRVQIEGLDAADAQVGQIYSWALGDIVPGGETSFVAEAMPDAVSYRMSVVSFDIVAGPQAP